MSAKDMLQDWKQNRIQQIKKLYAGGETRQELVKRFGAQIVGSALDKTQRYY